MARHPNFKKQEKKMTNQEIPSVSEEVSENEMDIAAETLSGDVRDAILDRIRNLQKPWQQMVEYEQRTLTSDINNVAENLVRKAVNIIGRQGRTVIQATLEKITIKDGIKAEISVSQFSEHRHQLCDSQGKAILIVVADAEEFTGERGPAEIDKDQGEIEDIVNEGSPVFDQTSNAQSGMKKLREALA
jgi:gas vesicle protein